MKNHKPIQTPHSFRHMRAILAGILLVTLGCVAGFILLLNGKRSAYLEQYTKLQQNTCDLLAESLSKLHQSSATTSLDMDMSTDYLTAELPPSGARWVFLYDSSAVLFAKDAATTEALGELRNPEAFINALKEQSSVVTTADFSVQSIPYTVGIITERSSILSNPTFTYDIYLVLLLILLLLLMLGGFTGLFSAWRHTANELTTTTAALQRRNREFTEITRHTNHSPAASDDTISIHHSGKSNRYKQYQFKFYLNARHAIYIDGILGTVHPHTWEITLHVIKMQTDFVEFAVLEREIEAFMNRFQNQELNRLAPFTTLNPTLENCCEYFKDELSRILLQEGWLLLMIEMSETPSRSYVISMIDA